MLAHYRLDILSLDIDKKAKEVIDRFGYFCNLTEMEVMEPREMRQAAEKLAKHFSSDLDELIPFGGLVAENLTYDLEHEVSPEATM